MTMATVEAVCTSDKKGIVKKERQRVILKTNWGIEGDAHAGDWRNGAVQQGYKLGDMLLRPARVIISS